MRKYLFYLAPLVLFASFLMDGQVSSLLSNLAPGTVTITSHLLLVVGLFYAVYLPLSYALILFFLLGCLYDVYYLGVLGIATTILPFVTYLTYYFYQHLQFKRVTNLMILLVLVFTFEFANYLLARCFQLTNLSVFIFVFYNLMPSLVFNFVFLAVTQPLFEQLFGITNKK